MWPTKPATHNLERATSSQVKHSLINIYFQGLGCIFEEQHDKQ